MTSELACLGGAGWKDVSEARPYPKQFRDDVVRVARNREDGVTIEQIAADFGIELPQVSFRVGCEGRGWLARGV